MAFTFSNLLQGTYRKLGQLRAGKATGGSTTTVIDTTQAGNLEDDTPKNGVMFIARDAGGAGAAPEGEFNRISAYSDATTTFTVDTALTTAVASGDRYAWCSSRYPIQDMIELCNAGLRRIGDLPLIDTSLTTAATQSEYAVPVGLKRYEPYKVEIQGRINDSDDNQWIELRDWKWVPAAAGSTGLLIFLVPPVISRTLKIWYRGPHGNLNAFSDVVNERIDPELCILACALEALEWQNDKVQGNDPHILQKLNKLENLFAMRKSETPIEQPERSPQLMIIGSLDDSSPRELPWNGTTVRF